MSLIDRCARSLWILLLFLSPTYATDGSGLLGNSADQRWSSEFALPQGCNGLVNVAIPDGDSAIYVGGSFTACGNARAQFVARFDLHTQTWSSLGDDQNDFLGTTVNAMVIADGSLFVGGDFFRINGLAVRHIARFDLSSRTWNALGNSAVPVLDARVNSLAATSTDLYVGGQFSVAGGIPAGRITRYNFATQGWSSLGSGANGAVRALVIDGSKLYAGGSFTMMGGQPANQVARWNTETQTWSTLGSAAANVEGSVVYALTASTDSVVVAGNFSTMGGIVASNIARFDLQTQSWTNLAGGVDGSVHAVTRLGNAVVAGGRFASAGGLAARKIARFDESNQTWHAFAGGDGNGADDLVVTLTTVGQDLYAGGLFSAMSGLLCNKLARLPASTALWTALGNGRGKGLDGAVSAMASLGEDIYVAGTFRNAGDIRANYVAKFNTRTRTWSSLGSGPGNGLDASASAVVVSATDVYVGGVFYYAGGEPANRVARFNLATQVWSSLGSGAANGIEGQVLALAVDSADLFVGGYFQNAGGRPAGGVARFHHATQSWIALESNSVSSSALVQALALSAEAAFVGGSFTRYDGVAVNGIARFDRADQSWAGLSPTSGTGHFRAISSQGANLYIAGGFSPPDDALVDGLGRYNTVTRSWSKVGQISAPEEISLHGTDVYATGTFSAVGEAPGSKVARWTGHSWLPLGSGLGGYNGAALVKLGGVLYVGGRFGSAGPYASANFAAYRPGATVNVGIGAQSRVGKVNQAILFGAKLSAASGIPTGEIRIVARSGESCTMLAPEGTCAISFTSKGSRTLHAQYLGDVEYEAADSLGLDVLIEAPDRVFSDFEPLLDRQGDDDDQLGSAVAVGRQTIVVGAPRANAGGEVLVYTRTAGLEMQVARLNAPIGVQPGDRFGAAVAITSDDAHIVIGAPGAAAGAGRVYVFDRFGADWVDSAAPTRELTPSLSPQTVVKSFGGSLAINDRGEIVVGAADSERDGLASAGAVFAFPSSATVGSMLMAPAVNANERFGAAVAIDAHGRVAVGVPGRNVNGAAAGALELYQLHTGGADHLMTLTAMGPGAACGTAVARNGDYIAAGCPGVSNQTGAAVLWVQAGTGAPLELARLTVNNSTPFTYVGQSIALSTHQLLIGAPRYFEPTAQIRSGGAFLFDLPTVPVTQLSYTTVSAADGANGDMFGSAVALNGKIAVIGIPLKDAVIDRNPHEQQGQVAVMFMDRLTRDGFE